MNRSKSSIAVGVVLCLLLSSLAPFILPGTARAQPADSPWPMFGQNPQRTGQSPYSGPGMPYEEWSFTTGREVFSSPAVGADGTIYVGSCDYNLYALNPDGTERWRLTTGHRITSSPAIGADGTIYVGSHDNNLYAVNPEGNEKWRFTIGDRVRSSPAIGADGTIYVGGSGDGNLYALNYDGSEKWHFTIGDRVHYPAIGADGTIYVGSSDDNLYAVNPDGSEKWRFTTGWPVVSSSPAIGADGTVYIGSRDGKLYALNSNGSEKWRFTTGGWVDSSPAIGADGTVYVGSRDNNLYAVDPDGSEKGRFTTWESVTSSPAIGADGTIYIGSHDNNLYALTEAPEYDLTIASTAGGSVTVPGEGTLTYDGGTKLELVAVPDADYVFVEWTGDVDTIANVNAAATTITMYGDYAITANFEEEPVEPGLCFIATAAYGTPMAEEIQILRDFRDDYLLTNRPGKAFVDFYYGVSPPIAELITERPVLKPIVRVGLMPAVAMSTVVVNTPPAEKAAITGLLTLVAVSAALWTIRRRGRGTEYA